MRIQTIHPAVTVGETLVQFERIGPGTYEAEVDDVIGQTLLDIAQSGDYRRIDTPAPAPDPDPQPDLSPVPSPAPAPAAVPEAASRGRKK